jgi:dienelactone hydrolase
MKYRHAAFVVTAAVLATACARDKARAPASSATPMPAFFTNGDVRLAFTLDLPSGAGPFPAVVLGHGSGRTTRQLLRFQAAQWTTLGFAVLRFDKRGVGESGGQYANVGTADSPTVFPRLAGDIAAGVRFLRTRPEIDPKRIGLSGWSQAGWILPIAARELGRDVRFLVIMSGPVCSVGLEMYYSEFAEETTTPLSEVYPRMAAFKGPPGFDPVPTLQAIDTPTLWLLGTADRSIPERNTVANLRILAAAGKPFEWKEYDGLDHPLSAAIWADVGRWVARFK